MEIIIKLDHEEPVKVKTSSIYGEMPKFPDMDKIRDKFWTENYVGKLKEKIDRLKIDLQNRDNELQDLKLENNRLIQREEIMLHFIKSCACGCPCNECDIKNKEGSCHYRVCSDLTPTGTRMTNTAEAILSKLEEL